MLVLLPRLTVEDDVERKRVCWCLSHETTAADATTELKTLRVDCGENQMRSVGLDRVRLANSLKETRSRRREVQRCHPTERGQKSLLTYPAETVSSSQRTGSHHREREGSSMPKKIIICFDGTWNKPVALDSNEPPLSLPPEDDPTENPQNTNVVKIKRLIDPTPEQVVLYFNGVGTDWYDHIRGGVSGEGLSTRVKLGYQRLAEKFESGDQIFLFGFSRGAYTARSLGGLIRKCGILKRDRVGKLDEAYSLYRRRDPNPDLPDVKQFRAENSVASDIQFIGVWDTVGSLGIPIGLFKPLNEELWGFHDTSLSGIVKNAFHALAIDEHRRQFQPTLWTNEPKPGQTMEQRWFIGAHSNVGGGYADDQLSNIALAWMCRKARECGLRFKKEFKSDPNDFQGAIRDSYADFLGDLNWFYRLISFAFYRNIRLGGFRQTLDRSPVDRLQWDPKNYPLKNLRKVGPVEEIARQVAP